MAVNIKFDLTNNPEPLTINLANRNGNILGQLDADYESVDLEGKLNDISEFTFTLNKYIDGKITNLWDKVVDFKLVYCREWDTWFEIKVEIDEETETIKTVFCTQLEPAELSQLMLYNIHINEEGDSNWDSSNEEYKSTILYSETNKEISLLDRLLKDKAPHYSIKHVDDTIKNIQRTFSFDESSIYDAFMEIGEEIGCLFLFKSEFDENGILRRYIYVYDLQQNCNDCGHRGEYIDECPKCGSANIEYGYGEDTTIFVTADELAEGGIQLTTDTDSVKNCFKLEAGDDLMTATVRNCNPNGTDYIWRFSDHMKEDMSDELVERLESYDKEYRHYYNEYESELNDSLLNNYNAIVNKYTAFNKDLQIIPTPIKGYSALMNSYYNTVDLALYLESGLMPSVEIAKTNAKEQASLLTDSSLPSIAVTDVTIVSLSTANSAALAMAKTIVKPTFKIQVNTSELVEEGNGRYWKGNFVITNYSDEEDTAISKTISVFINDDLEAFTKQKIEKALNKENTDDLSISGLFKKELIITVVDDKNVFSGEFYEELKKYALNPLISFRDACQACIDILIEQGVGNNATWADTDEGADSNLYEKLYIPYYDKLIAIESEIKIREDEINIISGVYDSEGNLITEGLQFYIDECRIWIQSALDFKKYLGDKLWLEFCAYRREDKYSNENYISDGLNNAELFKKALEFFEVAENEIYKASELQHSISTTLKNLLAIPKFKPLVKHFNLGNWIRVQIDERVYKLRLIEYGISYGDFSDIPVEFSDVTKIKNGITDVQNILSQASSMATSYDSVKRQASQGEKSNTTLNSWVDEGLNATNMKIIGTENQNQVWDKNGILCREYNPITNTYSDEQLKIINSTIAITDDNWKTTKTAIGKYYYKDPVSDELKMAYGVNGETIVGKFILGENLTMQNESGDMVFNGDGLTVTSITNDGAGIMTFNENGLVVRHGDNAVTISPKSEEVMNITNGEDKVFEVDENGELSINGNIIARSLRLENGVTIDSGVITNLATVATSGSYDDLLDTPTKLSDFENDSEFIAKDANNLTNYYNKSEIDNALNLKVDKNNLATVATTGSYNDLVDIEELKNWVNQQIQNAIGLNT
jgi:hypothetical protein